MISMRNDQAANLRKQFEHNVPKAKTIAFVSGKGGVGKSNTALNFSMNLLKRNKRVLLMDMDIGMGNIEVLLGMQSEYAIADFFTKGVPLSEMIVEGPKNLRFIAGGSGLSEIFRMDPVGSVSFFEQFSALFTSFDFIIFDMGAGASDDSMQCILAADECFVVATPEPTAMMDAYSMMKHIIKNKPNMPIYMIMNQIKSIRSGKQACTEFKQIVNKFLGIEPVHFGLLPTDQAVHQAVMRQHPYTLLNERAPISKAMEKLTDTYLSRQSVQAAGQDGSFIEKFRKWIEKRQQK